MSAQFLGIGIVGCGNISDTHAQAIINSAQGKLVAAHSRTASTLDVFCSTYDISGSTSYDDFLATPGLDAVAICTPSGTHLDYGKKAAEAGKHVVVEKPIEVTVKRGLNLIGCCKKNGVELAVIYQNRFLDDAMKMKKVLDESGIGKPVLSSASVRWFRTQEYYSNSAWRGTFALDGGGAVINQSIHTIDLLCWFMGEVESVSALKGTFTHEIEAEDTAVACLQFKNGSVGVFEGSTSVVPAQKRRIEINGSEGSALLEGDSFSKLTKEQNKKDKNEGEAAGAESPLTGMSVIHHRRQFDQIFDAITGSGEPMVSGEESLKSLAVVEAIYKAAETGQVIKLDDILENEF